MSAASIKQSINCVLVLVLATAFPLSLTSQFVNKYDKPKSKRVEKFQFKRLILNSLEVNEGNFASIDTKDSKIDFSGNIVGPKNKNIVSLSIDGGITEGFASLFTGLKVNPSVGLEVKSFTFLGSNINTTFPTENTKYHLNKSLDSIGRAKNNLAVQINHPVHGNLNYYVYEKIVELEKKKVKIHEEITALDKKITDANARILAGGASSSIRARDQYNIDVWQKEVLLKLRTISQVDTFINVILNDGNLKRDIASKKNEELTAKEKNLLSGILPFEYHLYWLSLAGGIQNNTFRLFNDEILTSNIDDQITKGSFNNRFLEVAFNYFTKELGKGNTRYFSIGVKLENKNNLDALTARSVIDIDTINTTKQNNLRTIRKETAVYNQSEYNDDLFSWSLFLNSYWFLDKENKFALRINPIFETVGDNTKLNFNIGGLFTFKSKDKENPLIVLEIVSNLTDIFESPNNQNKSLFQRSVIGANLKFPFKYTSDNLK